MEADDPLDMPLLDDLLLEVPVLPEETEELLDVVELDDPEELVDPELDVLPVLFGAAVELLFVLFVAADDPDVVNEPVRLEVEGVGAGVAVGVLVTAGGTFLTSVAVFGRVLVTGCCPDLLKLPAAAPMTAPAIAPASSPEEIEDSRP